MYSKYSITKMVNKDFIALCWLRISWKLKKSYKKSLLQQNSSFNSQVKTEVLLLGTDNFQNPFRSVLTYFMLMLNHISV